MACAPDTTSEPQHTIDPFAGIQSDDLVAASIDGAGQIETFGDTDRRVDAVYQLGSISKYVCTLAALDLQSEGRLDLNRPLSELLPDYAGESADIVTLAHLLENRSGLEDGLSAAFRSDPSFLTREVDSLSAANTYGGQGGQFTPGERFDYALSNWVVVQAVLEAVSGQSIDSLLSERVFGPAGIGSARVIRGPFDGSNDADAGSGVPPLPGFVGCAGGIGMTVSDLARLVRYPYVSERLDKAALARLTAITTPDEQYAVGGRVMARRVGNTVHQISWQDGSNGPFKSRAAYDPQKQIGLAVVTAKGDGAAVETALMAWLESHYSSTPMDAPNDN